MSHRLRNRSGEVSYLILGYLSVIQPCLQTRRQLKHANAQTNRIHRALRFHSENNSPTMSTRRRSARRSGVGAARNNAPSTTDTPNISAPEQPSGPVRQPRITPRNSLTEDTNAAEPKETPYTTLRQLANIIPR